jgi:hypothetical protein
VDSGTVAHFGPEYSIYEYSGAVYTASPVVGNRHSVIK